MNYQRERYTTGEKSLTKNEWDKLIGVVDNLEDEVLFKLTVTCGFRREDICHGAVKKYKDKIQLPVITGIKIKNIELDNLSDSDNNKITYTEHKKNRDRTIHISKNNALLIRKLINSRGKNQSPYLITYSGATAYRKLQKYCDKAGIPRRPFHALRATCIKFCQGAGWTPEQVSRLTGDTIAVIQEHYSTPSDSEMAEVVLNKTII